MPKSTFFNLPKEKKELLMDAATKEFSRVPFYEASVANIIKDANIPRGSFYQYFEDKDDLFYFLFEEHSKKNRKMFLSILKNNDGDLLATFYELYQLMIVNIKENDEQQCNFFKHTFLNMNHRLENTFSRNFMEDKLNEHFFEVSSLINKDNLNIESDTEIISMMKIIMAVTFHNLIHVFAYNLSVEESVESYKTELDLLKKGFYKK